VLGWLFGSQRAFLDKIETAAGVAEGSGRHFFLNFIGWVSPPLSFSFFLESFLLFV
jgi:hypothetical protein